MATPRISIEPRVIEWARLSAGLDQDGAAKKIGVSAATLQSWESGDAAPTITQLRKVGKTYGRPLAVLLLTAPPSERGFDALRDFRTSGSQPASPSPALLSEFRRALDQRDVLLDLYRISPDSLTAPVPLPALTATPSTEEGSDVLRSFIGVELQDQLRARDQNALNLWRAAVEDKGILVIHVSGVDPSEMHGFSISDWPFPIIAINGADQPRRRLFTLLHELAHLAMNLGGVCDLNDQLEQADVERICNQLAAGILLPRRVLLDDEMIRNRSAEYEWTLSDLLEISRKYGCSSEAALLRLVSIGRATWPLYWDRKEELEEAYAYAREQTRQRSRESTGGPSYYVVKVRDLGHGYTSSVIDAYRNDRISSLDVADYLGIRYSQLPSMEAVVR